MEFLDIEVQKTVSLRDISNTFKVNFELVSKLYMNKFGLDSNCVIDNKSNIVNAFLNKRKLYIFCKSYPNYFSI